MGGDGDGCETRQEAIDPVGGVSDHDETRADEPRTQVRTRATRSRSRARRESEVLEDLLRVVGYSLQAVVDLPRIAESPPSRTRRQKQE